MSKLHDIFKGFDEPYYTDDSIVKSVDEAKEAVKALMLELIGEDETRNMEQSQNGMTNARRTARNNVKRELRQKVSEL